MRVGFTEDNKIKSGTGYPKLKLAMDERVRVAVLETPLLRFMHSLRSPVVDLNTGQIMQEPRKNNKTGEEYFVDKFDFAGSYTCSGEPEVVREKEIDPDNCIICKAVKDNSGKFDAPEARYIMHIIKYAVSANSVTPMEPFQAELLLWQLSPKKFDTLVDIATEHKGNIMGIDLILGPCTSGKFQQFPITAGAQAYFTQDPSRVNFVKQLFSANHATEEMMSDAIAKPISPVRTQADIESVLERWSMVGRPASPSMMSGEFGAAAAASQNMDAAQNSWGAPAQQPPVQQQTTSPDFLEGLFTNDPAPAQQPPVQQQAAPPVQQQQPPVQQQQYAPPQAEQPAPVQQQAAPPAQQPAPTDTAGASGDALDFDALMKSFEG